MTTNAEGGFGGEGGDENVLELFSGYECTVW